MSDSFHKTNLGQFGESLPCDLDGYVHLTAKAWLAAPMDAASKLDQEQAEELATEAREATAKAEAELAKWQNSNA